MLTIPVYGLADNLVKRRGLVAKGTLKLAVVKDEGLLEKFEVSLEEAQHMVMTARIQLGWVDPAELEAEAPEDEADEEAEA